VLATGLGETVPVVLGDGPLTGVAAIRAASMLARTARVPATSGALPDAASQVVACLDGPFGSGPDLAAPGGPAGPGGDIFADPYLDAPAAPRLGLLALRDPDLDREQVALADAVVASARDSGVTVWEQQARSGRPIERLASLVALTDFAATYLALGLGLDPSVSRHVTELRDRTS
jgi:glucose/mannose-6-phosphate isomerase